jgi:hypothetical protein
MLRVTESWSGAAIGYEIHRQQEDKMKKLQLSLSLMAAIAAIVPAFAGAAPVEASGTWDDCNFAPSFRAAGPNFVGTVGITENFFGTLLGTYAGIERDVVYADGGATFHGSGIFTGSVAERSGTATFSYEGIFPAGQQIRATWVLTGLSGSLASVRGHGTFDGSFDGFSDACDAGLFSGSYGGSLHIGP